MRIFFWRKYPENILGSGGRVHGRWRLPFGPQFEELEWRLTPAAPVVLSINRTTPALPNTNATSIAYTVTFDQLVAGVDAADFKVTTTNSTTAAGPVVVAGSGAAYDVTIDGIHGSGDVRLDLIDDDSITGGGLPLGGAGAGNGSFHGQTYTVLQAFPSVISISLAATSPNGAGMVGFTITFSEPVTGVDPTDFALVKTGTVGTTLVQVTPISTSIYTATISGITGSGTLGLNLVDDASIHDLAGNPLTISDARATFANQATFATGTVPVSVTSGDVNGDGKADLALR